MRNAFLCSLLVFNLGLDAQSLQQQLLVASGTSCCTYYVSQSIGSDSNPGTQALPWQTIAKVNATTLSAGQSVGFKSGDTWREELTYPSSGTASLPITFTSYGSGAEPILSGSNLLTAGWTKNTTHVWKTADTTQPNVVYFNGTRGTSVASAAAVVAPLEYFWATNVLYVWSPPDSDPSLYYTMPGIEAGTRARVVQTNDASYVTLDGLTIRDANALSDGMVNIGSNSVVGIVFQNCVVERGATIGIGAKGAVTAGSLTINNCAIQNNGGSGIWDYNQYTTATFSNNTITGNGWASVRDNQEYSGIEDQLGNANIFGNTIYGNAPVCKNAGSTGSFCHGIYVADGTAVANVHSNTVYSNTNGSGIKAIGSANIYNNVVYSNALDGFQLGQNTSNVVYSVYLNVAYLNNTSNVVAGCIFEQSKTGTLSLTASANTCYENGGTSGYELFVSDNLNALTFLDNALYASSTRRTMGFVVAQTGTVLIDYNIDWRADGAPNIAYNGTFPSWSSWKSTTGFDAHSLNSDPLFNNAGAADFTLQSGSPAIGAGIYIPGVSTANPPNIGAF